MRQPLENVDSLASEFEQLYKKYIDLKLDFPQLRNAQRKLIRHIQNRREEIARHKFIGRNLETMSMTEGIKQIMWEHDSPMKVATIIEELDARGVECAAKNKDTSIRTTLMRSRDVQRPEKGLYHYVTEGESLDLSTLQIASAN
ncbi:MAG: hypothetical protein NUW37_12595 [Planctomycetes bacterium]|nr:hypothetical protein [Planctomycetota bacterium]